jgi:phage-related protein
MHEPLAKRVQARFWRSDLGTEPVRDSLKTLSKIDKTIIGQDVMAMEMGWPIGMPTCRAMGGGLHEVRSRISGDREYRILFYVEGQEAILLHSFVKKTRTTPKADLELALKRMRGLNDAIRKAR